MRFITPIDADMMTSSLRKKMAAASTWENVTPGKFMKQDFDWRCWQALCFIIFARQRNHHYTITIPEQLYSLIVVESRLFMQSSIDTKVEYQGITLDESMALRQLFDTKKEELVVQEQFSDLLLFQGLPK